MTNDWQSRTLDQIERGLIADDPAYVARMRRGLRPTPSIALTIALLYVTVPVAMVLFGATGVLIAGAVGLGLIGLIVVRRRRRTTT